MSAQKSKIVNWWTTWITVRVLYHCHPCGPNHVEDSRLSNSYILETPILQSYGQTERDQDQIYTLDRRSSPSSWRLPRTTQSFHALLPPSTDSSSCISWAWRRMLSQIKTEVQKTHKERTQVMIAPTWCTLGEDQRLDESTRRNEPRRLPRKNVWQAT